MKLSLSRKSLISSALLLSLLFIILVFIVDWQIVYDQISQVNSYYLLFACGLLVIGYVIYAIRWKTLLSNQCNLLPTFHVANIGNMMNTLLPLRPGDAARIFLLGKKEDLPFLEVTSSIVVERWFEQILRFAALGGAIILGVGFQVSNITILGSIIFLAGSFIGMVWLIRNREIALSRLPKLFARLPRLTETQIRKGLENLVDGLAGVSSIYRLFGILLISILTWSFFWGFHFTCLISLQQDLSIQTFLALSLGSLALVPPSASTLPGMYQVSMVVPLSLFSFDKNLLTSYSLVMNFTEMVVIMGFGLWGTMQTGISSKELSRDDATRLPADQI